MPRFERQKREREAKERRAKSVSKEQLASDFNVILRTLRYPDEARRKQAIQNCLAIVGKELAWMLLGRKTPVDTGPKKRKVSDERRNHLIAQAAKMRATLQEKRGGLRG